MQFDWTRILKPPPGGEGQGRREGRDRDRDQRGRRERPQRSRGGDAPSPRPVSADPIQASVPAVEASPVPEAPEVQREDTSSGVLEFVSPSEETGFEPEITGSDPPDLLSSGEGGVQSAEVAQAAEPDEAAEPTPVFEPRPEDQGSASYQRLGAEGLVRLRARYAEVMARIAERPLEEEAREELKQRAERLNPDAWVTADEVTAALEQYETVFEGLRGIVGRHPRGRRRGRRQ